MKVVHFSTVHAPDDNRVFKMCKTVAEAGNAVTFVVPTATDAYVDGVSIKAVPEPRTRTERMLTTTRRVYQRAVDEDADIYHFHDPELIPVALRLQLADKRNVIYDVHEDVPVQIHCKDYIPKPMRAVTASMYGIFERRAARYFSAIVTANEDINYRFNDVNCRVVAIHNYAESSEFKVQSEVERGRYESGVVLHSGASERTSFPAAVSAVELLRDRVPIQLLATTNMRYDEPYVDEIAGKSSVGEQIVKLGTLPRDQFTPLLLKCAASLVLYADSRNHLSIRSNRFYESMAAGAPVITADFPEWKGQVESLRCGLAVNATDPRAIAEALKYLLTNPQGAAAMGRCGRRAFLEMFNWRGECQRLLELYEAVLTKDGFTRSIGEESCDVSEDAKTA